MRSVILRHTSHTLVLAMALAAPAASQSAARHVPTIEDLLALKQVSGAQISPDGAWVAYAVSEADLEQDAFVTHLWRARAATGETYQLTRGPKSAGSARWSPDSRWLAFTSTRVGDKNQIFAIRPDGGEAIQLTKTEGGVNDFAWSNDGSQIAFTAPGPEAQARKDRKEHLGDFEVVRRDYTFAHIWTLAVADAMREPSTGVQRSKGTDFHVGSIAWSPDGTRIAFSATRNPDLIQGGTADLYLLALADDTVTKLVSQPGPDGTPRWSPDGTQIAFVSAMGRPDYFHANSRIAVVPASGGTARSLTDGFDESPGLITWAADGNLYFSALQKTAAHLFRLDPATGRHARVSQPDALVGSSVSLTRDASQVAFVAASPTSMGEVFVSPAAAFRPRQLTTMTRQLDGLVVGTPEVIAWKSQDGAEVEGVLVKPADFDPSRKYPLLLQIHGGPTGVDRPTLVDARYYPTDLWVGRGALVLKVNYRGSAGYGQKFRQLNVGNLGVGDAWDVLSGVDALVARGWVDPKRIACMGWSQGGYISAFLTTSSDRFAAISVGAGISNWATYYYNTDITPFTIQYLGDDPADDPEIYRKTSPMSYIRQAKTPTLIQHGENDRRVPIPNAYELRQGLEDRGVPVRMVVYRGFGHGITKPKSMRAVMRHDLEWFNHYLWGDPLPDFETPAVPKNEGKDAK
jgi:dipeptidyl aminopeptidase/acylaminoacyl peptidase